MRLGKHPRIVIPAKARIQKILKRLDSRLRGNDSVGVFFKNLVAEILLTDISIRVIYRKTEARSHDRNIFKEEARS